VFEKHADFLRDTVHPVTMRLLDELGLFLQFDALPQSRFENSEFNVGGRQVTVIDFRRLHQPHPYIALVPQWDFLVIRHTRLHHRCRPTSRARTTLCTPVVEDGQRFKRPRKHYSPFRGEPTTIPAGIGLHGTYT
jgi:2-polyprenyl-6-methoxyphenol hydroxylase-like FAD-dependent oxidoreductase